VNAKKTTAAPPKGRKGRRLKRFMKIAAWALVVLVVLRIALSVALPHIADKVAQGFDMTCSWEQLDLSILTGNIELWHLDARTAEGDEPFAAMEYCRADVDLSALLWGRVVIRRVEVDGLDVMLNRNAAGAFEIAERFAGEETDDEAAGEDAADEPDQPGPIDFTLPVEIKALRLQHAHIHLRDESVTPVFEERLDLNLRVSSLGSDERRSRFELVVSSPALLDQFVLEGTGSAREKNAEADLRLQIRGLRPHVAIGYLEPLGIEPVARTISVECNVSLRTAPALPWFDAFSAHMLIDRIRLAADGQEAIALDHVELTAPAVGRDATGAGFAEIERVVVADSRARAARLATGELLVAGLKLAPVDSPGPANDAPVPDDAQPRSAWRIDRIALRNVGVRFTDEAVEPAADLSFYLEELTVRDLADEPAAPRAACFFAARFSAPGVAERIDLSGTARPFGSPVAVDAMLSVEEITVHSVRPYLDAAGIEPTLERGSFSCRIEAELDSSVENVLGAEFAMTDLRFADEFTLFGLDSLSASGVAVNSADRLVHVDEIALRGTRCDLWRDRSGLLEALGFRFGQAAPPAPPSNEPNDRAMTASHGSAPTAASEEAAPGQRIEIDRILLTLSDLVFADSTVAPRFEAALSESSLEVTDLVIDPDRSESSRRRAGITGIFRVPGLAEEIELKGSLLPDPAAPSLSLAVEGKGITAQAAAGYLEDTGLELPWDAARFRFVVDAELVVEPDRLSANASIRDLVFADGDEELAGIDEVRVSGVEVDSAGVRIAEVGLVRPRAHANRTSDGTLTMAGVQIGSTGGSCRTADPVVDEPSQTAATATEGARSESEQTPLLLKRFLVQGAEFSWTDSAVEPAVTTAVILDLELGSLSLGAEPKPASLLATLRVPGSVDDLTLSGSLVADPAAPEAHLEIDASGLRAGPLSAYFSPEAQPCLEDGRFSAVVDAGRRPNDEGGQEARLSITGIEYADGTEQPAFVAIDTVRAVVGRLDPEGRVITVDEIAIEGLVCNAEKTPEGALRILGMEMAPAEEPADENAPAPELQEPDLRTPDSERLAQKPRKTFAPSVSALPPLVTIKKIDLGIEAFTFHDRTRPGTPPLTLTDFSIRNPEPIVLLGDEPESCPPAKIAITGTAAPALDRLAIDIEAELFAPEPQLRVDFAATGIDGQSLADALRAFGDQLAVVELDNGRLGFNAAATLRMHRRQPLAFDFSKDFGLEFVLQNLSLTNGEEGPVLAGFEELRVDVAEIAPESGDMHIKMVEVVKPQGMITQTEEGLHLAGFVFKPAPEPDEAESSNDEVAAGETPAETGGEAPAAPGPEIRVDRIFVSGIDFTYSDTVAEPDMIFPLVDLDVDIRKFTTRAFSEPVPIRFDAYLKGGKVPLRKRIEEGNLFTAIGRAAVSIAGGDEEEIEERPILEEITVSGKLALSPTLSGRIKAGISAVELAGFEGAASGGGVILNDGILDAGIDLRFKPDGSLDTVAEFTFTDLSLSEPPDGPISRYLSLPAPLDMVVFLLRDEDGAIEIPLDFEVGADGMSTGEILSVVSSTLGSLIADAVAASPFRLLGTAGDIVPVGDLLSLGDDEEEGENLLAVGFHPGDAFLSRNESEKLEAIAEALRDNEKMVVTLTHELGAADMERAALRANPSRADCIALAARLRQKKAEITEQHDLVAAQARAAIAAGLDDRARTARDRIGRLERELGLTERSLDRILEFLRPGAERQAVRRMREACIAVGRLRLDAVRDQLAERLAQSAETFAQSAETFAQSAETLAGNGIQNLGERIRVKRPRFDEPTAPEGGAVNITW